LIAAQSQSLVLLDQHNPPSAVGGQCVFRRYRDRNKGSKGSGGKSSKLKKFEAKCLGAFMQSGIASTPHFADAPGAVRSIRKAPDIAHSRALSIGVIAMLVTKDWTGYDHDKRNRTR
jgi:hypothetical protein